MTRAAVIAIGSNSTRLLVADCGEGQLSNRRRGRVETRLFMVLKGRMLSSAAIARAAEAVCALRIEGEAHGAAEFSVIATSAVRDAVNADALCTAVRSASGLDATVLTGAEEAAFSFFGAVGKGPSCVLDIGGGSSEITYGEGKRIDAAVSIQMGASRLFTMRPIAASGDVPQALALAALEVSRILPSLAKHTADQFYLVGGTGTALASIIQQSSGEEAAPEGFVVLLEKAILWLNRIAATPREKRADIPGLRPERADIMPTGLAVLVSLMSALHIPRITVTERGNTDGWLRKKYCMDPTNANTV